MFFPFDSEKNLLRSHPAGGRIGNILLIKALLPDSIGNRSNDSDDL